MKLNGVLVAPNVVGVPGVDGVVGVVGVVPPVLLSRAVFAGLSGLSGWSSSALFAGHEYFSQIAMSARNAGSMICSSSLLPIASGGMNPHVLPTV